MVGFLISLGIPYAEAKKTPLNVIHKAQQEIAERQKEAWRIARWQAAQQANYAGATVNGRQIIEQDLFLFSDEDHPKKINKNILKHLANNE